VKQLGTKTRDGTTNPPFATETCPVAGHSSRRHVRLSTDSRRERSCVRASPTDAGFSDLLADVLAPFRNNAAWRMYR
jgi:hypothetical protein